MSSFNNEDKVTHSQSQNAVCDEKCTETETEEGHYVIYPLFDGCMVAADCERYQQRQGHENSHDVPAQRENAGDAAQLQVCLK